MLLRMNRKRPCQRPSVFLVLLWLTAFSQWAAVSHASHEALICRLTVEDTLYHDPTTDRWYGEEQIVCDALHDDNLYSIDLPPSLLLHENALKNGDVWVRITDAHLNLAQEEVRLTPTSTFTVIPDPSPDGRRRLRKAYSDAFGVRTYAVVIVSTTDSTPTVTAQQIQSRFTNSAVGLEATYRDCSANQLDWQLKGVYTLRLPKSLADYGKQAGQIRNAAVEQLMREQGLESAEDLANNILFCLPPGTGSWIANAGTGHWRSQFNDAWCISLTAVVHEIGHNLGLGHSNENGEPYSDWTGMMASGLPDADKPRKCFNAANNVQLGWYSNRERRWTTAEGPKLIKLAAFVDYLSTSDAEPVVLSFGGRNQFHAQYNLATKHNEGTEEYRNELVVIEQVPGSTELRAHLKPSQSISVGGVTLTVCGVTQASPVSSLLVGIGNVPLSQAGTICQLTFDIVPETSSPTDKPSPQPSMPPVTTSEPTLAPTYPKFDETITPTQTPTKPPFVKTYSPSREPTDPPVVKTSTPSQAPTEQPSTALPTSAPSPRPSTTEPTSGTVGPSSNLEEDEWTPEVSGDADDDGGGATETAPPSTLFLPPSDDKGVPGTGPPTIAPSNNEVQTDKPTDTDTAAVEIEGDGTTKEEEAAATEKEPKQGAESQFLEAWEKLALGTTWFEYFRM